MKETILYIDDEIQNLEGFKATFWRSYDILLANSAKDAYRQLKKSEFKENIINFDGNVGIFAPAVDIVRRNMPFMQWHAP